MWAYTSVSMDIRVKTVAIACFSGTKYTLASLTLLMVIVSPNLYGYPGK